MRLCGVLILACLLLAACGGGGGGIAPASPPSIVQAASPTPSPSPSPTPLNTPVLLMDQSGNQVLTLQLYGTGNSYAQVLQIVQSGYTGAFTANGCSGIATATISSSTLAVTGDAAGTCTLTVIDQYGLSATLPVSVTISSMGIQ